MAEVTNELILEHLKRIQTKLLDLDDIKLRIGRVESAIAGLHGQFGIFAETDAHLQGQVDQLRRDVDRINRRLEIHDPIG